MDEMMIRFSATFSLLAALFLGVLLSGCREGGDHAAGVAERIKEAQSPIAVDSTITGADFPEKTVLAMEEYQGGFFRVEARRELIERYPCTGCHNEKEVTVADGAAQAHGDIVLEHGEKGRRLVCFACHKPDNRNLLEAEEGFAVDFDHSYRVCGYCHFRQKRDWIGGAHGKRMEFWAGARVVKNCTSCHDPHSPRFKKRWPKTYSLPLT